VDLLALPGAHHPVWIWGQDRLLLGVRLEDLVYPAHRLVVLVDRRIWAVISHRNVDQILSTLQPKAGVPGRSEELALRQWRTSDALDHIPEAERWKQKRQETVVKAVGV